MFAESVDIEALESYKAIAKADPPVLHAWKVRIPIVVDGPREEQRVLVTRNGVERWAEVEVAELHERSLGAEESHRADSVSDGRHRLHRDPVAARAWELLVVELNDVPGGVVEPDPAGFH